MYMFCITPLESGISHRHIPDDPPVIQFRLIVPFPLVMYIVLAPAIPWWTAAPFPSVFMIMNDMAYFPSGIFVYQYSSTNTRNYNPFLLQTCLCRTNYFMFSFVPHSISLWNSLPPDITGSPSLSSFRSALLHRLLGVV